MTAMLKPPVKMHKVASRVSASLVLLEMERVVLVSLLSP